MNEKVIYLDNNATTQVAPEVLEAMLPFFKDRYGNPSSIYRFGGYVRRYVEQAREQVADFLGASPEEFIFTSCGSESDNLAFKRVLCCSWDSIQDHHIHGGTSGGA
jgi:cysteine desulfurase